MPAARFRLLLVAAFVLAGAPLSANCVRALVGGRAHSLLLATDGTVWATGDNRYGQLGDGTNVSSLVPVEVTGLRGVVAIGAGKDHSLAVTQDGTAWSWGDNRFWQLGDGTSKSSKVPVQSLSDITAVAGGEYHSLALKGDGTVWAWGVNSSGQLGTDGELGNGTAPGDRAARRRGAFMEFLPSVVRAEYLGEYRVRLTFNDGLESTLDFWPWLHGPVFEPLKDRSFFQRFFLDGGTLAWPNGADVAPETLYAQARANEPPCSTSQPATAAAAGRQRGAE